MRIASRQTKFTAYVTLYVLIVVAALGLANYLANRYNKSVDTTANKKFSLSDQTKKVVSGLQQDVRITYWDKTAEFQRAKDLLERYDTLSAKLSVDYVDPYKKPQLARQAGVRSEGAIFVDVGAKHEEAKSLTEEEVTGALIRALKGGARTVCSIQGSGEHSFDEAGREGYSQAKQALEQNNYAARTISLLEKPEVPSDCTVLMVAGPRFDYVQPAVDTIKAYVDKGGRLAVFLDPPLKIGKEPIADNTALMTLLGSWGVTPEKNLVLDTSGIGQIFGFSAAVPLVTQYGSHAIVREMKGIATAFPLARSISGSGEKLFSTTENSFATKDLASSNVDEAKGDKGPFTLGVALTQGQQGRIVVTGSSGWAANSIFGFNGNRDLFLNVMNWLSSDEDLISIRPKDPDDRRLSLSRAQMNLIFYASVILMPLAVIAAGVSVWWKRR